MKIKSLLGMAFVLCSMSLHAADGQNRFYYEGDGVLRIFDKKTGAGGTFKYRDKDGQYNLQTLDRINEVFGMKTAPDVFLHPRLIALLDYLQDQLKGGPIRIVSGYRSPNYNEGLRKNGRLAARTSMHIEAMAADIDMDGVDGKALWEFVRSLDCCGAGFYHGKGIHVDVGPSRFWDETSTKVEQDLGAHNKLVLLRTNFDYYDSGERVYMTLGRITDYPVGIRPKIRLVAQDNKELESVSLDSGHLKSGNDCLLIHDWKSGRSIKFDLPGKLGPKDKIQVSVDFCDKPFPEMPDSSLSNSITIR